MKVTGKYSVKPYTCRVCGYEWEAGTNHWGAIYTCPNQGNHPMQQGVADCNESPPEGVGLPEEWAIVKLEEVVEIV